MFNMRKMSQSAAGGRGGRGGGRGGRGGRGARGGRGSHYHVQLDGRKVPVNAGKGGNSQPRASIPILRAMQEIHVRKKSPNADDCLKNLDNSIFQIHKPRFLIF